MFTSRSREVRGPLVGPMGSAENSFVSGTFPVRAAGRGSLLDQPLFWSFGLSAPRRLRLGRKEVGHVSRDRSPVFYISKSKRRATPCHSKDWPGGYFPTQLQRNKPFSQIPKLSRRFFGLLQSLFPI